MTTRVATPVTGCRGRGVYGLRSAPCHGRVASCGSPSATKGFTCVRSPCSGRHRRYVAHGRARVGRARRGAIDQRRWARSASRCTPRRTTNTHWFARSRTKFAAFYRVLPVDPTVREQHRRAASSQLGRISACQAVQRPSTSAGTEDFTWRRLQPLPSGNDLRRSAVPGPVTSFAYTEPAASPRSAGSRRAARGFIASQPHQHHDRPNSKPTVRSPRSTAPTRSRRTAPVNR